MSQTICWPQSSGQWPRSRVLSLVHNSVKCVPEPKFRYHRNSLVKPRRMKYFCLVKVKSPRGQGQVKPLRSWLTLGRSNCMSVDSGANHYQNDSFLDSPAQFDRMLLTKNADDLKGPLRSYLWGQKKMQKRYGTMTEIYDNEVEYAWDWIIAFLLQD